MSYHHLYLPSDVSTLDALVRAQLPYQTWRERQNKRYRGFVQEPDEVTFAILQFGEFMQTGTPLAVASWLVRGLGDHRLGRLPRALQTSTWPLCLTLGVPSLTPGAHRPTRGLGARADSGAAAQSWPADAVGRAKHGR